MVDVRLLGPVELRAADSSRIELGPPQQRSVLAVLAMTPGRAVAAETLIDRIWRHQPPENVRDVLYTYVSRLRRVMREAAGGPPVLRRGDGGYVLDIAAEGVDLHRSRALARRARAARERDGGGGDERAVELLREAAGLWRGTPLAGLKGEWALRVRAGLQQELVTLLTDRFEIELGLGRHADAVAGLSAAAVDHPLAEPLTGQLMLALYRTGRQADALAAYARVRQDLVEELGEEPGPALRRLHERILRHDPGLDHRPPGAPGAGDRPGPGAGAGPGSGPGSGSRGSVTGSAHGTGTGGVGGTGGVPAGTGTGGGITSSGTGVAGDPGVRSGGASGTARPGGDGRLTVRPAQLPADVSGFTGRSAHLRRLDEHLDGLLPSGGGSAAAGVTAIVGTAGVGKTTLAVHWAHRVAGRFPDGQLYVNLRGFDESRTVVEPAQALRGFLEALQVPPDQMPSGTDALSGMFRSVLAGRRMLVMLDNARDVAQVRPLLPGAPGCLAVVTSRNQLPGLLAATGAFQLTLGLFTPDESAGMFAQRLGAERLAGQGTAVAEIAERCARLPLALAIVAAHAAARPDFPLDALAAQLREAGGDLTTLSWGDLAGEIRAVFSWSYRTLGPDAARLFRLLGLHAGPDLAIGAAASLAGLPPQRTRGLLGELTAKHLLSEHVPGRFSLHDLLRDYAAELVRGRDPGQERREAVHRLLAHYVHAAHAACQAVGLNRTESDDLPPAHPGSAVLSFGDAAQGLAWFAAEHRTLIGAVDLAVRTGFDRQVTQLAWLLAGYLDRQGHWHEQAEIQQTATRAALRLDDGIEQARALCNLARSCVRLGRFKQALSHLEEALGLFSEHEDVGGQADVHHYLTHVLGEQGEHAEALSHAWRAHDLYHAVGSRLGQGRALNEIGWCHTMLEDDERALTYCREALAIQERIGDWYGAAATWDSLGRAHHHLGDWAQAITCYQRSLDLYREPEAVDRLQVALGLTNLGDSHRSAGSLEAAREAWGRALAIMEELRRPEADKVRARLAHPDRPPPPLAP